LLSNVVQVATVAKVLVFHPANLGPSPVVTHMHHWWRQ